MIRTREDLERAIEFLADECEELERKRALIEVSLRALLGRAEWNASTWGVDDGDDALFHLEDRASPSSMLESLDMLDEAMHNTFAGATDDDEGEEWKGGAE